MRSRPPPPSPTSPRDRPFAPSHFAWTLCYLTSLRASATLVYLHFHAVHCPSHDQCVRRTRRCSSGTRSYSSDAAAALAWAALAATSFLPRGLCWRGCFGARCDFRIAEARPRAAWQCVSELDRGQIASAGEHSRPRCRPSQRTERRMLGSAVIAAMAHLVGIGTRLSDGLADGRERLAVVGRGAQVLLASLLGDLVGGGLGGDDGEVQALARLGRTEDDGLRHQPPFGLSDTHLRGRQARPPRRVVVGQVAGLGAQRADTVMRALDDLRGPQTRASAIDGRSCCGRGRGTRRGRTRRWTREGPWLEAGSALSSRMAEEHISALDGRRQRAISSAPSAAAPAQSA